MAKRLAQIAKTEGLQVNEVEVLQGVYNMQIWSVIIVLFFIFSLRLR